MVNFNDPLIIGVQPFDAHGPERNGAEPMRNIIEKSKARAESYILEIDGTVKSEYGLLVEALKAGLLFKQQFPNSNVKVHDASEQFAEH